MLTETLVMVSAAVPVLVNVTLCAALVVLIFWLPKLKLEVESVTAGCVPVPVRFTLEKLGVPLSVKVRVPVWEPVDFGVKVTLTVQLAPTARLAPQLVVSAKFPYTLSAVMLIDAVPTFVSTTAAAALVVLTICPAKLRLAGEVLGAPWTAVPLRATDTKPGAPLSLMVTEPVSVPAAFGVNVTLMLQLAPAARLAPQLLVSAKAPETLMLVMLNAAVPVLLRVTFCAALVVETS